MWEPFSEPARALVVNAQKIAVHAGQHYIGTEHLAYALTRDDSDAGRLMASVIDRTAIEAKWSADPATAGEMVFSQGAKQIIEKAFENARRIDDTYIGTKHIALALLDVTDDPVPILPGTDTATLRIALAAINEAPNVFGEAWRQIEGEPDLHPTAAALQRALTSSRDLAPPGTQVTLSVAVPHEPERSWAWRRKDEGAT